MRLVWAISQQSQHQREVGRDLVAVQQPEGEGDDQHEADVHRQDAHVGRRRQQQQARDREGDRRVAVGREVGGGHRAEQQAGGEQDEDEAGLVRIDRPDAGEDRAVDRPDRRGPQVLPAVDEADHQPGDEDEALGVLDPAEVLVMDLAEPAADQAVVVNDRHEQQEIAAKSIENEQPVHESHPQAADRMSAGLRASTPRPAVRLRAGGREADIRPGPPRSAAEDGPDVVLGLGVGRHAAVALHRLRAGVVGRERQPPVAEAAVLLAEVARAALEVLLRVVRVHAEVAGGVAA